MIRQTASDKLFNAVSLTAAAAACLLSAAYFLTALYPLFFAVLGAALISEFFAARQLLRNKHIAPALSALLAAAAVISAVLKLILIKISA